QGDVAVDEGRRVDRIVRRVCGTDQRAGGRARQRRGNLRRIVDPDLDVAGRDRASGDERLKERDAGVAVRVERALRDAVDLARHRGGEIVELRQVGRQLVIVEVDVRAELSVRAER